MVRTDRELASDASRLVAPQRGSRLPLEPPGRSSAPDDSDPLFRLRTWLRSLGGALGLWRVPLGAVNGGGDRAGGPRLVDGSAGGSPALRKAMH